MNENFIEWSVNRKNTDAQRKSVITHLKASKMGNPKILPPIFFKDIDELSEEEIVLLDNLTFMFFKGEECGSFLF